MTAPALILFLLATSPAQTAAPADSSPETSSDKGVVEAVRAIRTIEIDESRTNRVYRVRTSIGIPAIVQFPESFDLPITCGDCAVEPPEGAPPEAVAAFEASPAYFIISPQPEQSMLALKPKQYPVSLGGQVKDDDYLTTVTIRLKSQLVITLQVEYSPKAQADARVVFTLPGRAAETAYVREALQRERAALDKEYAAHVEAGAQQSLLEAFMEPHECVKLPEPNNRDRNLRLYVHELCHFGRRLFVTFLVENRSKQTATLGGVSVKAAVADASPTELLRQGLRFERNEVPFNSSSEGCVLLEIGDATAFPHDIEVSLEEVGGLTRHPTVSGLNFSR